MFRRGPSTADMITSEISAVVELDELRLVEQMTPAQQRRLKEVAEFFRQAMVRERHLKERCQEAAQRFVIAEYEIHQMPHGQVWISREGGEGMGVTASHLGAALDDFWNENF
jgi:hypothetical protein